MRNEDGLLFYKDQMICVVLDKYPKAAKHFLVMPIEKLQTLYDFRRKHIPLVEAMIAKAKEKLIGVNPNIIFKMGFHAFPSMAQVHMHVISQDFDSPCLKTKRHWNSFNTDYFVPSNTVLNLLKEQGSCSSVQITNERRKREILSRDLQCNQCHFKPKNMPDLKMHLREHLK